MKGILSSGVTKLHKLKLVGSEEPHTDILNRQVRRVEDPLRDLARRASDGDAVAIRELIMELGGPMLRTVRKVLGVQHPDVQDVTQDAIMGFLSSLPTFRGDCSVTHFARHVALRRALHARRHFKNRNKLGDQELDADGPSDAGASSPLSAAISRERRRIVHSLLEQLSEPAAEALALHFMLGYSVSEIASMLDISPDTIWSRLKIGKKP